MKAALKAGQQPAAPPLPGPASAVKRPARQPSGDLQGIALTPAEPGFSRAVIDWQRQHGRHHLPWQGTRDAYRIWLSEIMLQQTQVTAVVPYYQRFLERFPDVLALADAPLGEVMALWSGLGYYTRARNLHRCARQVRDAHGGVFPTSSSVLAELPGIGPSTAAAIAAFSSGERAAILDGNVKRVFCRVFGIEGWPGQKAVEDKLWARARALLPEDGMTPYTQGLMDLGATVCVRSRPHCDACPLSIRCVAFATGRTAELPARRPARVIPEKQVHMLVLECAGAVLLEQRGPSGIWGGLLSLPELVLDESGDLQTQVSGRASRYAGSLQVQRLEVQKHQFTHYTLYYTPWLVKAGHQQSGVVEDSSLRWIASADLADAALPAPVKKLLLQLFGQDSFTG